MTSTERQGASDAPELEPCEPSELEAPEFAGFVTVEWPTPARRSPVPVVWAELTIRDALTGEPLIGVTDMTITASTSRGHELTVEITEILGESGAPIRGNNHREHLLLDHDGQAVTATHTFLLAPCVFGGESDA